MKTKRYRVSMSYKSVYYFDVEATSPFFAGGKAEKALELGQDPADYWESPCLVDHIEPLP